MEKQRDDSEFARPLQVPAKYAPQASLKDRVVFALADIGSGTAEQIVQRLTELSDPDADVDAVEPVLERLFDQGLINGTEERRGRVYDLAKVTRPHRGHVNPDSIDE
ncbi:hypothetical protein SAMN05421747_10830 [Parapedobacter composti]|uniref:Uncharacterized protein n=1 Tax=Parapedobacter composti TaxID=623281 RepID=A0A1I1I373_9SPHI|nr:hypothetical protein [Parapedobacter composti]SFC30654.1 hypothetical protein SAMN05421747_10830 [Parapedobacter composti]